MAADVIGGKNGPYDLTSLRVKNTSKDGDTERLSKRRRKRPQRVMSH